MIIEEKDLSLNQPIKSVLWVKFGAIRLTKNSFNVAVLKDWITSLYKKSFKKNVFRLFTTLGQRKNSESSWGIEPQTFGFCAPMLYHRARDSTVSKAHHEVLMTRVLHTARVMLCALLILTFDSIARFTHTDYLEYFAPDFSLYPDIAARIENQNTKQVSLMLADSKLNLQIN